MNPLENLVRTALGGKSGSGTPASLTSDLDNPKWETADEQGLLDESGQMTFGGGRHGSPGLRTSSMGLDLLHGIEGEVRDYAERLEERGEKTDLRLPADLAKVLAPPPDPIRVIADVNPAAACHMETVPVPAGGNWLLLSARTDRMWIEITNQGAVNPVLLSQTDDDNLNVAGEGSWITIAPTPAATAPVPRRFPVGGKLYVYSILGTTIDYIEAYGYREPGTLNP